VQCSGESLGVAGTVQTPPPGRRLEDGQSTVAVVDDDAGGDGEGRLAVGIGATARQQPSATADDPQVLAAVRTGPCAVEPLAHRVVEGVAGAVDAHLEGGAALDTHRREATVRTAGVEDGRSRDEWIARPGVEVDDGSAGADKRAARLGVGADGNAGLGGGVDRSSNPVGSHPERPVVETGGEAEAVAVGFDGDAVGTGEPRHRLVARGVVDEDGSVGFDEDEHPAAVDSVVGLDGAVAGEGADGVCHGGDCSRHRPKIPGRRSFGDGERSIGMDAVLFDMDGVIVDTEEFWREREAEVILPAAVAEGDPEQTEIRGVNYRETYDYLAERYEMAIERAAFLDLYESAAAELYDETDLMPGFRDLLVTIRDAGVGVAIVSSSPRAWIDRVVERFDLDVDAAVSTEDVDGPGKPAPDVYLAAAERVGADPAFCVAVEDSPNGVRAATRAGITTVAYGGDPEASEMADHAAADPAALRAALGELGAPS